MDRLKVLDVVASSVNRSSFCLSPSSSNFYLWHSHLDHVCASRLKYFVSIGALRDLKTHDIFNCSCCKLEKFYALLFDNNISSFIAPFNMIYSNM